MGKLVYFLYELLEDPFYFLELALSDLRLFPNLKKFLIGYRLVSNEAAVD